MTFNLLDSPWIPARGPDGLAIRSVREVLIDAPRLSRLAALPPTINVAILRQILIPIVIRAFGSPQRHSDIAGHLQAGAFNAAALDAYLDTVRHRFDLFDPEVPFGQIAGLATAKGEVKSIALAMIRADLAVAGGKVEVEIFGDRFAATVHGDRPLWDPDNERLKS